jgi:hypothetical protein
LNYIISSSDKLGLIAIYIQPIVKVEKAQPGPGVVVSTTSGTVPGHITAVNTGEVCFAGEMKSGHLWPTAPSNIYKISLM